MNDDLLSSAQSPMSPGHWPTSSTRTYVCGPRGHSGTRTQRKELEDVQARLDTSEARTRQPERKLEDLRAAAEDELHDACTSACACVLESELEHEHAVLEEERKRTTEL